MEPTKEDICKLLDGLQNNMKEGFDELEKELLEMFEKLNKT